MDYAELGALKQSRDYWQEMAARRTANLEQYTRHAENNIAELIRERDSLRQDRDEWLDRCTDAQASAEIALKERDDAIHEVERLRAMLPPTAYTGVRNGPGEGSWAVFAQKVVEERDAIAAQLATARQDRETYHRAWTRSEEHLKSLADEHDALEDQSIRAETDLAAARARVAELEAENKQREEIIENHRMVRKALEADLAAARALLRAVVDNGLNAPLEDCIEAFLSGEKKE